jgi:hypothetical protein
MQVTPVTFAPGWLRLATSPIPIGFALTANSIRSRPSNGFGRAVFAIGKLGILAGLPDEGKGQVLTDMATRTTRASEWPCGEGFAPLGNVILLTAEDGIEDTVVPRLLAANSDLNRIEIVSMVVASGNRDRMFNLGTDLGLLRKKSPKWAT